MKKLLISTALVASMGFGAAAFAQTVTPITDASGNPLYTWVDASGNVQQGTFDAYTTYTATLTDPGATAPATTSYGGTTYTTVAEAVAAYNADVAAYTEATTSLVALTEGQDNSLAGNQESLLQSLLSQAENIQVSLANTSENLANIDGSIAIDLSRFEEEFDVNAGVDGVTIMEPLNATIGQLTTTVIGSLGDGSVISTSVLSNVEEVNQAMTQTSDALNLQFGAAADNLGLQQVYNLSSNLGALDASVDVVMAGVNLDDLAGIATTAIGSLGTGAITSDVTNNAAGLTERLIGTN
jgi:hypothetical protein